MCCSTELGTVWRQWLYTVAGLRSKVDHTGGGLVGAFAGCVGAHVITDLPWVILAMTVPGCDHERLTSNPNGYRHA